MATTRPMMCDCGQCGRPTLHLRHERGLPWGHLLMIILTFGLWIFVAAPAIAFRRTVHPECTVCGQRNDPLAARKTKARQEWAEAFGGAFGGLFNKLLGRVPAIAETAYGGEVQNGSLMASVKRLGNAVAAAILIVLVFGLSLVAWSELSSPSAPVIRVADAGRSTRAYPPRSRKEFLDAVAAGRNQHWDSVDGVLTGGTWTTTLPSGSVRLTFVDSTTLYVKSQSAQTGQWFDYTFQWAVFHITTDDNAILFWLCWIEDSPMYTCWDAALRQTTHQGTNTIGLHYKEYFSTVGMEFQPSSKRGSYYLNQ